jgi:DNA polymerase III epsilon subunit-like protein
MALKWMILDLETTGFSEKQNEITQISIIRCEDRVQFSRYIKPKYPERCSRQALEATGRTMEDLQKGEDISIVAKEVNEWIQQDGLTAEHRCCVIHSKRGFDRMFIHSAWSDLGLEFPIRIWFDTETATKDYFKSKGMVKESVRLSNAIEKCGITVKGKMHNAVTDARATYKLHKHLIENGIDHLKYIKRIPQP